jgi:hypothetical protein
MTQKKRLLLKVARRFPSRNQRVGFALGGDALEPFALAGLPSIQRLQPLEPDTRKRKR